VEQFLAHFQTGFIFAVVLSILIFVHELGHFLTAVRVGVKVERFALGFGPKLFSWKGKETEYAVCLIPLGGYVKMAGDERSECKGGPREFYSQGPAKRAWIILNGPLVNFLFAYICLAIVFMIGYPDQPNKIGELIENYPAQQAGLQIGDEILEVNDKKIENWTNLQQTITSSVSPVLDLTIKRDGDIIEKSITPKIEVRPNIFGQEREVRLVGIAPPQEIITLKYPFFTALGKAGIKIVEITELTYKALFFMITGSMSPRESVTGPIGIFFIIKSAAEMGFSHLLFIMGVISASLAIFNLLPIIPLDGGHILLLLIEKIRGKALPEHIDDILMRVGFIFIILLALFVFYNDIVRFSAQFGWIEKIKSLF
jgi:regulator of sigma E protease